MLPKAPVSVARSVTIAMATLLLSASLMAIVAVQATYDGRWERTAARTPDVTTSADADMRFAHRLVTIDATQVSLVHLDPLRPDADPPPGLAAWPEPGTVAISSTLADQAEAIVNRYGPISGQVSPSGLSTPTEKLIYARPSESAAVGPGWHSAQGYGESNRAVMAGDVWTVQEPSMLFLLIVGAAITPAIVLVVVAAQLDEQPRRRRHAILETLGARPRSIVAREVRAAAPPTLLGALAALALFGVSCVTDLALPGVGYRLAAADSRNAALEFGAAVLVAAAVVTGTSALMTRPRGFHSGTRPQAREPRYPGWAAALAIGILGATGLIAIQEVRADSLDAQLWIMIGTVLGLALTPSACGWALRNLGAVLHELGASRGRPALMVVGAQLRASPRSSARLAAACAMVIILVGQLIGLHMMGTADLRAAETEHARHDGHYLTVHPPTVPSLQPVLDDVVSRLPDGTLALGVVTRVEFVKEHASFTTTFTGSPEAFAAAGLSDHREGALPGGLAASLVDPDESTLLAEGHPQIIAPSDDLVGQHLLLLAPQGGLDTAEVEAIIHAAVAPSWSVREPGELWRVGAATEGHQMRWIRWFGSIGAAMLMLAAVLRAWQASARNGRISAPLTAVAGDSSFPARRALVRAGAVTATAVGVGGAAAVHMSGIVDASGTAGGPARESILLLCLLTAGAVTITTLHEIRAGLTATTRWLPGKDLTR